MPQVRTDNGNTSSVLRAMNLLDLFGPGSPVIAVQDVMARFGYSRSTAYRYLSELVEAGLVAPAAGGVFSLGPRVIELERLAALTDPLYLAGHEVLQPQDCGNSTLLLHSLYRDKVLCIYKAGPDVLDDRGTRITIRRARGIPFPLFQGAASLAMLSCLPASQVQQTYLRHAAAIAAAGLGGDWETYRRNLLAVRRAGYAVSNGQITPSVTGVAVPIRLSPSRRLIGSLARAFPTSAPPAEEAECAEGLRKLSEEIAKVYARAAVRLEGGG